MKRRYGKMYAPSEEGTDELVNQYKEDTPGQGKGIEEHCGVCGEGGIEEDTDKDKPGTQGDQAEYQRKRKEIAKKFGVDACAQLKDEDKKKACFAALDAAHVSDDEEKEKKEEVEMEEAKGTAYPATVDTLRKIVKDKQNQVVMFKSGQARVDTFTASAIIAVYDGLKKPELKKTLENMIKTKEGFLKTQAFAMKMVK
jgi:hypothetical protein